MPHEITGPELVRRWSPAAAKRMDDSPHVCEDCGNRTDLGYKCRDCYRIWSRLLWQDIPAHQLLLSSVAKTLNAARDDERKLVADMALGFASGRLQGRVADLYASVKKVLEGPFGPSMKSSLEAVRCAVQPQKTRSAREEVE